MGATSQGLKALRPTRFTQVAAWCQILSLPVALAALTRGWLW